MALNALEREEAALLSWGVVDVGATYDEVVATLAAHRASETDEAEAIFRALNDRKLILSFTVGEADVWRTRAAETVRLASTLRQLFPRHLSTAGGWRQAPELVADYRFSMRPRRYPVREHDADAVVRAVSASTRLSSLQEAALRALVGSQLYSGFQVAAAQRLLADADGQRSRALIVGAGTGSGKTKAFYTPALTKVVESAAKDSTAWARVVALYPRNELLKDQLTTALGTVLDLNNALRARRGARALSLGAFYGDAPYRYHTDTDKGKSIQHNGSWKESREGWECPFLREPRTGKALVWRREDVTQERERLYVVGGGPLVADEHVLRLMRGRLETDPPDLLFASTEMLQRAMGTATSARMFGIRENRPPELVLLDEVHTYGGTTGAQVAYLLRRYRHALGGRGYHPHFTGLSATLANAVPFFSDLVGVPDHAVASVRADDASFPQEEAGHEYLLALRGHPFSGAGLLSTTIQTVALMRRVLDPRASEPSASVSRGMVGQRVFVFTDDLDVTNRLYDDIADAEGLWQRRGRYVENPRREPLAALRSPEREDGGSGDEEARFVDGQSWRLAEKVGHPPEFSQRLGIDRVSSQDAGIDAGADIIVATASLEVGYDDDTVGAVVQHKAPRDVAQFLQRKGRGGRPQEMRPWTVVTLSDYGRDRSAYQNYDALFDPEVQPQHLPMGNRYVLRMQAAAAMVDWVATRLLSRGGRHVQYFDPYKALSGAPFKRKGRQYTLDAAGDLIDDPFLRTQQVSVAEVLRDVLSAPNGAAAQALRRHIRDALGVSENEATALLWEPPRALLTGAAPTLLRRVERHFEREGAPLPPPSAQPLAGFIPENLFSDLDLPEVVLHLPSIRRGATYVQEVEPKAMGVQQALREFAPGRVSRRFGYNDSDARHWIPVPTGCAAAVVLVDLKETVDGAPRVSGDAVGEYRYVDEAGAVVSVPVVRPYEVRLEQVPRAVRTSSHGQARWHTELIAPPPDALVSGAMHPVSSLLSWSGLVHEVLFYTHLGRAPLEARRFTTGSDARVVVEVAGSGQSESVDVEARFVQGDEPTALGFAQAVDAVAFAVTLPTAEEVLGRCDAAMRRSLRTAYLRHLVVDEDDVEGLGRFQREWVYQALLGTAAEMAAAGAEVERIAELGQDLDEFRASLVDVLDRLLEAGVDLDSGDMVRTEHAEALSQALGSRESVGALAQVAAEAWSPTEGRYHAWVSGRMRVTLGAALLAACGDCTPGRSEEGLLLDLDAGPEADPDVIWVSEATLGGNGLVESVLAAYTADPRTFFAGAERALQGSDLELVAAEMPRVVRALSAPGDSRTAAAAVRSAEGLSEARAANAGLREALSEAGVLCTHAVYAALSHRLLRPGSHDDTADLAAGLIDLWDGFERRAGVEIDARVFVHLAARDNRLAARLGPALGAYAADRGWRAGAYTTVLWARGVALRSASLQPYNPFVSFPPTDRSLVLLSLPRRGETVDALAAGWVADVERSLTIHGEAFVEARDAGVLSAALLHLAEVPLEAGFLHLHPRVDGVERTDVGYRARLLLPEALQ